MPNYQIRSDTFPATVRISQSDETLKVIDKARVIVTLDHIYVFLDAQPVPAIEFEDRLVSYTPPIPATRVRNAQALRNRNVVVETEDGFNLTYQRMSSCGCGSRLKTASLSSLLPNNGIGQAASTNDQ